jgi:hypothetical protein
MPLHDLTINGWGARADAREFHAGSLRYCVLAAIPAL